MFLHKNYQRTWNNLSHYWQWKPKLQTENFHYLHFSMPCSSLGIFQADVGTVRDKGYTFKLFCHESLRVFHDRLINHEDKNYFYAILAEMASKHWGEVRNRSCFVCKTLFNQWLCSDESVVDNKQLFCLNLKYCPCPINNLFPLCQCLSNLFDLLITSICMTFDLDTVTLKVDVCVSLWDTDLHKSNIKPLKN